MKKQLLYPILFCLFFLGSYGISAQNIRITSIVEGDCPNVGSTATAPRIIEMYVDGTVDLSTIDIEVQLSFQDFWNSVATLGTTTYADGFLYYINDADAFDREFPGIRTTENTGEGAFPASAFGGDKWRLVDNTTDQVIDLYGIDGANGENEDWNFSNSYAQRKQGNGPNAIFTATEWNLFGADELVFEGICWDSPALENTVTLQSYNTALNTPEFEGKGNTSILFPNPVFTGKNFQIKPKTSISRLEIYSLNGILVKEVSIPSSNHDVTLKLDQAGIYVIQATEKQNGNINIAKLIVY